MPHFDQNGNDTVICQCCCRVISMITGKEVEYRKDICFGNVCKRCMQVHNATKLVGEELRAHIKKSLVRPISLQQHCSNESGFPLGSRELNEYISRYYVDNGL